MFPTWVKSFPTLLTLDHGKIGKMIAARIAQLRPCHNFAHPPGWWCMSIWPAVCKSESQHEECAIAYHQAVLKLQVSHPLRQQQCHQPDATGYTGATCRQHSGFLLRYRTDEAWHLEEPSTADRLPRQIHKMDHYIYITSIWITVFFFLALFSYECGTGLLSKWKHIHKKQTDTGC